MKGTSYKLLQYSAAVTGCITILGYGTVLTWSSPALPYLEGSESDVKLTKDQAALVASIYQLGFIIGFLLNPVFIDRIGRKWTLLLFAIPQTISWLLIIYARNEIYFYCARIIGGIGYGGGLCAMTVYMSEVGNKKNRGIFLILIRLSMSLGFFLVMFLGACLTYQKMNYVLLMLPIIFGATFSFMPDSSYFRAINDKIEKSELELESQNEDQSRCLNENKGNFLSPRETQIWKLFSISTNRRALTIVMVMGLLSILSGQVALGAFGHQILSYKTSPMDPNKGMILMAALNALSSLVSIPIVERIKRRTILIFTGLISSISLLITGMYFYMEGSLSEINLGWIPIISISIFDVLLGVGHSNIFYIYQGEMFANEVKSMAVTVVKLVYVVVSFFMLFYFKKFANFYMHVLFWIFGICCCMGTIFVYVVAPETQGKTLGEIQNNLRQRTLFYRIYNCFVKNRHIS